MNYSMPKLRESKLGLNKNRQATSDSVDQLNKKNRQVTPDSDLEDDFREMEGGYIKYVRGSGTIEPPELKELADIAIRSYNRTSPMKYGLVDIVTANIFSCAGFCYEMTFTAKLRCQNDADALTFEAWVHRGIMKRIEVHSVRVVDDAPAISSVSCC